jgi:WD40 repeat protein
LKPDNVLLQTNVPEHLADNSAENQRSLLDQYTPKVADFGLAKDLEVSNITRSHELLGSLPYMAPEQLENAKAVGPSTDIHALGVILYECLTGRTPFLKKTPALTIQQIVSEDPIAPRKLVSSIPIDLDSICRQCLEKKPANRYLSAAELAADLRCFLDRKPTFAKPVSPIRSAYRWACRNPLRLTIYSLVLLLVIGLIGHTVKLDQVNRRMKALTTDAQASARLARMLHYASEIRSAGKSFHNGDLPTVRNYLDELERDQFGADMKGIEWAYLQKTTEKFGEVVADLGSSLYCIDVSNDGKLAAVAGQQGVIWIFDLETGSLRNTISSGQIEVNSVAFSNDDLCLASAGDDGSVCVWEIDDPSGRLTRRLEAHQGAEASERFTYGVEMLSLNEGIISCGKDGYVNVWSGDQLTRFHNHDGRVAAIAVSPDERYFASVGRDQKLVVRELPSCQTKLVVDHPRRISRLSCVTFSPDSNLVAIGEVEGKKDVKIFNIESGELVNSVAHRDAVSSISFSPDGLHLLSTDKKGIARIFQLASASAGSPVNTDDPWYSAPVDSQRAFAAKYLNRGKSFLAVGKDGTLRRFEPHPSSHLFVEKWATPTQTLAIEILHNGEVALASKTKGVAVGKDQVELADFRRSDSIAWDFVEVPKTEDSIFFGGTGYITGAEENKVHPIVEKWDTASGPINTLYVGEPGFRLNQLACSPNGRFLAIVVGDNNPNAKSIQLLDARTGEVSDQFEASTRTVPRFSRDSNRLYYGLQRDIHVVDLETGERHVHRNAHRNGQIYLAVCQRGRWLATCDEREIKIWDISTLSEVATLQGHQDSITAMRFSPDGKTLLSSSRDGTVKAWKVEVGKYLLDLHVSPQELDIHDFAISDDGRKLAVVEEGGAVWLYDLELEQGD